MHDFLYTFKYIEVSRGGRDKRGRVKWGGSRSGEGEREGPED